MEPALARKDVIKAVSLPDVSRTIDPFQLTSALVRDFQRSGGEAAEVRGFAIGAEAPTKALTERARPDRRRAVGARGWRLVVAPRPVTRTSVPLESSPRRYGLVGPRILVILPGIARRIGMSKSPQRRALDSYRRRLTERGMSRFEVIGRDADRDLIRSVAKRLAEDGADADRLRAAGTSPFPASHPAKAAS